MELHEEEQLRILVIEDSLPERALLEKSLLELPLPIGGIEYAECLGAAIELLDQSDYDAVLLDLNLSDSQGLNAVNRISRRHPYVAIVVMTGEFDEDLGLKAVGSGAQDYLTKNKCTREALHKSIAYAIERQRTHKIIDRKQRNLEVIFDAVPLGMLLIDEKMVVKRVNEAIRRMVRRKYLQIINRSVGAALGCDCIANERSCGYNPGCQGCLIVKTIEAVFDSGQPFYEVEARPILRVGNTQITPWLCISAEPVVTDGKRYVVLAVNDITDRKKTADKLKETMEMKSQFISTVSHEFRTPLACIKEGVLIVLEEVAGKINEHQRKFLDIAKRNIDRLGRLINEVLDLQKLEAGRMELDMQANSIGSIVEDVHSMMLPAAEKKQVKLSVELEDDLPEATFDSDKIIQVLTNLIGNAIKFTEGGGQISVAVRNLGEELAVSVSDTGIGIAKDDLPKVFKQFYCARRPGQQILGTGLGLAIVDRIVRMHNGRINVQSELNQGTTFTVYLPIIAKPLRHPEREQADVLLEEIVAASDVNME